MRDPETVPSWPELIIWMCFGESEEPPFTGVLEIDDRYDLDADEDDELPRTVRVHKAGSRYRVESLVGDPLYIRGADRCWRFSPGSDTPGLMTDDDEIAGFGSYAHAIARPNPRRWRGNDFTNPTGPPRASTYLGRPSWEIDLAPPPHKPAPVRLTVDAATGMPMRWSSDQFGDVFRWTEIHHDVVHDEGLFEWEGDYVWATSSSDPDAPEDIRAAMQRDEQERARKLADLRMPPLRVEATGSPDLHAVSKDGTAHLSYDLSGYIIVERRPHSGKPWDHGSFPGESIEWTTDDTDWYVRVLDSVDPSQLASIRRQLTEPRPSPE